MSNIIALRVIAFIVLLPSTLVAGFISLMGATFVASSLRTGDNVVAGIALLAAMVAGWFGLTTAWRLYYGMLCGRTNFNPRIVWAGLACGCLTSLGLIATASGSLGFRFVFFGWPLLAAGFFAVALRRLPHAT